MTSSPSVANASGPSVMVHFAPPPANLTPAPTLGGEPADPKPEPETKFPPVGANNGNRPGEPEWVTHSGIEGRPYLTEEIYESPNKTELFGEDRCKDCIELGRACVTILKFPTAPVLGDLDVCGYCARDGKKKCGAGQKAFDANIRKQIADEGQDAISKRRGRRISTKPMSPDVTATPDRSALSSSTAPRNLRRSLSTDSETSEQSAPKRPKMAIRRKKPGPKPKPKAPKPDPPIMTANGGEKYDGRKDPEKVALRVVKMKATLAAKKEARLAAAEAEKPAAVKKVGGRRKKVVDVATPSAKGKGKAVTSPRTEPKPAPAAKTTLRRPRSMGNLGRGRARVPPEDDYLSKDFVGSAPDTGRKTRTPAQKIIRAHRQAKAAIPNGSPSDVELEVNALLGSIEPPVDDDDEGEVETDGTSSFGELEAENESLRRSLVKLEARDKKMQLKEDNEIMKRRIEELKRKSISRRESTGAIS